MPLSVHIAFLVVLLALVAGCVAERQGDIVAPNTLIGPVRLLTGAP